MNGWLEKRNVEWDAAVAQRVGVEVAHQHPDIPPHSATAAAAVNGKGVPRGFCMKRNNIKLATDCI